MRSPKPYPSFTFQLPRGLIDSVGNVHQIGRMRLTTGEDERSLQQHLPTLDIPAYGILVMLSQVIVQLGNLRTITPELLEQLLILDLQYLLDFYQQINPPEAQLSLESAWVGEN